MTRLQLPDVRQRDGHSCGLAALNCVLGFFGRRPLPRIAAGVPSELDGTDPRTLEMAFRGQGLRVQAGEMTPADLPHHLRAGRPVVCLVRLAGSGHYVVVGGCGRGRVYFQCPTAGPAAERVEVFEARWHDRDRLGGGYDRWGLAVGQ